MAAAALTAGLFSPVAANSSGGVVVDRLAGADRYATAAQVALHAFPQGASRVYVGVEGPDALVSGQITDGPVLLVQRDSVPAPTLEALRQLRPVHITIIGGPAAVSPQVEDALRRYNEVRVTSQSAVSADAATVAASINAERRQYGLPDLTLDADLVARALAWSQQLAVIGDLLHDPNRQTGTAEVVAVVWQDANLVVPKFMGSPPHRDILLGQWSTFGIGIERDADGLVWVTGKFR